MLDHIYKLEIFLANKLSQLEFFKDHFNDPISARITVIAIFGLFLVIVYKTIFEIGLYFNLWDVDSETKQYFQDKLVHCAHVYIEGKINWRDESKRLSVRKGDDSEKGVIKYHIEFGPEEYNEEDPDLGTTLGFLKKKLYFLFKESEILKIHNDDITKNFKIGDVVIYNKKGVELQGDSTPLCKLGIETGDTVKADFMIN